MKGWIKSCSATKGARRGQAPQLEDIAGAKHWDNIPDQGFTVHWPKMYDRGTIKTEAQHLPSQSALRGAWLSLQIGFGLPAQKGRL
jgi:hypothetical protein